MTCLAPLFRRMLLPLAAVCLSGCFLSGHSEIDEQKEPHFLDGKRRLNALDYKGAIDAFEKALQINANSGSAHFELGCLYEKNEADPAAAIYHYEKFLKLQPNAGNGDIVRQHLQACKQELARAVLMGPENQSFQNEFGKLRIENERLRDELERYRAYYANHAGGQPMAVGTVPVVPRIMIATNLSPAGTVANAAHGPAAASNANLSIKSHDSPPGAGSRSHTVRAGETPNSIARQYGVRLDALMAANPRLEARKLRIGQTVNVPQG